MQNEAKPDVVRLSKGEKRILSTKLMSPDGVRIGWKKSLKERCISRMRENRQDLIQKLRIKSTQALSVSSSY